MRYIATTETTVKKIKALGRQISRERGVELHEGHRLAAQMHGYEDMHHVTHCASMTKEKHGGGQTETLIAQVLREAERFRLKQSADTYVTLDEKLSKLLLGWRKRPGGLEEGPTDQDVDAEQRLHVALAGEPQLYDAVGWWYDSQLVAPTEDSFAVTAVLERSLEEEQLPVARVVANPVAVARRIERWLGAKVTVARTAILCMGEPMIGPTLWQHEWQLMTCRKRSFAGDMEEGYGEERPDAMLMPGTRYVITCLIECKKCDSERVMQLLQEPAAMRGKFKPVLGRGAGTQTHAIQTLALGAQSLFAWYDRHVFDTFGVMEYVRRVWPEVDTELEMGVEERSDGDGFNTAVWAMANNGQRLAPTRSGRVSMPLGAQQAIGRALGRKVKAYYCPLESGMQG